ncbi:hypothetical protein GCM10009798_29210 [Nocardioides panacihumi]|uniref:Uncharacterized protein n=1 Tax=Nocardioides panacihumi TaxID=400774 RepID=A0ABN2RCT9_9ACTN
MRRTRSAEEIAGSVQAVDTRTGRLVSVFLDGTRLQVVAPDRTSARGVFVTEFELDEVVLAGPVARRVAGRRGGWVITRSVGIDDGEWGASAPAWSWLLVPDEEKESRRSGERFLGVLRSALPKERWARRVKLGKAARRHADLAAAELLELARRRDAAFAASCTEVAEERDRRAAGFADHAERMLLDALHWRGVDGVTTVTS